MAVLVEAISVIVRRDAIQARFAGGWNGFFATVRNSTLCADGDLARVGFMSPVDCGAFVERLERGGLTFLREGETVDLAIVDQVHGPTAAANWLGFARLSLDEAGNKVSACWLLTEPPPALGLRLPAEETTLAVPAGWTCEDSLSARFKFIENEKIQKGLEFLRHENDRDVYIELSTGRELYMGRTEG